MIGLLLLLAALPYLSEVRMELDTGSGRVIQETRLFSIPVWTDERDAFGDEAMREAHRAAMQRAGVAPKRFPLSHVQYGARITRISDIGQSATHDYLSVLKRGRAQQLAPQPAAAQAEMALRALYAGDEDTLKRLVTEP